MKKTLLSLALICFAICASAQTFKETFDSNSFEWTESPKGYWGSTIIDKGVMTITSKEHKDINLVGYTHAIETHCYCPLNMKRPFSIIANVKIGKLEEDRNQRVGVIFNYLDFGNYFVFCVDENEVYFERWFENNLVGDITQGVKWSKKTNATQQWKIEYDGNMLTFFIDDSPMIKVKYMEMTYNGFGFYSEGRQKFVVDDVTFIQK